jgi:ParB family chromosome partitioning protein
MDDAALVRRLAIEKLEAKAEELRPLWAWTRAVLDPEYRMLAQYARVQPKPAKVPADLADEIDRIGDRLDELEDFGPDEITDELMQEAARLEERRDEIDKIIDGLAVFSKKDRKRAGCIVTIGDDGRFHLHQGLIDRSAMPAPDADTGDAEDPSDADYDDGFGPQRSSGGDDQGALRSSSATELALRKELGFSQSLVDDLKAHRLQITRAHLAGNFEVAFDLALYTLCVDVLDHGNPAYRPRPLDLRAIEAMPRTSMNDLAGTAADRWLIAQKEVLEFDWFNLTKPEQSFAALAALPLEAKQRLFAWCLAATLKPQLAIEGRANPVIEAAACRLGIGFEDYWRPTAANYWGRVKKAHSLAIGREILGDRWARDHADDKKPVLAAALETAFDPQKSSACIALDQAARDTAAAWLPPGMAYSDSASSNSKEPVDRTDMVTGTDEDTGASADLPAFLTDDQHTAHALNGAAAD